MKTLLLLRHAKSSWDAPVTTDFDRPLAPRGERDAPRIGRALKAAGVDVEWVVASPAARAKRTAELVVAAAKIRATVELEKAVYEAGVSTLVGVLRRFPDEAKTGMLVGHNPGFEDLLATLCGRPGAPFHVRVPTAALSCIELETERWSEVEAGSGMLQWMLVPKLLA